MWAVRMLRQMTANANLELSGDSGPGLRCTCEFPEPAALTCRGLISHWAHEKVAALPGAVFVQREPALRQPAGDMVSQLDPERPWGLRLVMCFARPDCGRDEPVWPSTTSLGGLSDTGSPRGLLFPVPMTLSGSRLSWSPWQKATPLWLRLPGPDGQARARGVSVGFLPSANLGCLVCQQALRAGSVSQ